MTALAADIDKAASIIRDGGLVAVPTETVYGLAADATNDEAVARIFAAKGRPRFNPLISHFVDLSAIDLHAELSDRAQRLAAAFWPGPLTLVLPRKASSTISLLVSAGLDTLAIRMPAHPLARALIEAAGRPIAAPSANRSGAVSPTTADHVREGLGDRVDFVLDGGPCSVGVESTIVRLTGQEAVLLRPGGLSREEIEAVLGRILTAAEAGAVEAPGMLASHYAPSVRVRLNATAPEQDEAFLGFGAASHDPGFNLSPGGDVLEAAANLFAYLRALDKLCADKNLRGIAAAPVPDTGLGEAINDRLEGAAAPRWQ